MPGLPSPRLSQSHIPWATFPTDSQTHGSILSWLGPRKVGVHMRGVVHAARGDGDPPGPRVRPTTRETLWLLSNNDESKFGFRNTHTHCRTVTRSVLRTDVLVCQYMWSRFSIPLLVRLYFPDGWGFALCFNESRKWPLGTAQPFSLKSNPTSCVLKALQEVFNSAWGTESHPTPLISNRLLCIKDELVERRNLFNTDIRNPAFFFTIWYLRFTINAFIAFQYLLDPDGSGHC